MNNALAHAKEIDPTIELDDVKQVVIIYDEQKKKSHGAHSFVAHDNTSKYQIDMFVLLRTLRTTDMRQGSAALIYFYILRNRTNHRKDRQATLP